MTPKEKAKEIKDKMWKFAFCPEYANEIDLGLEKGSISKEGEWENYCAKQCALIAVDEILNDYSYMQNVRNANSNQIHSQRVYWQEVKQEIELL
jgi:hypothetical protein